MYEKAAPATAKHIKKVVKFYYFQKNCFFLRSRSRNFCCSVERERERDRGISLILSTKTTHNKPDKKPKPFAFPCQLLLRVFSPSGNNTGQFMAPIIAIMCCSLCFLFMKAMQLYNNSTVSVEQVGLILWGRSGHERLRIANTDFWERL